MTTLAGCHCRFVPPVVLVIEAISKLLAPLHGELATQQASVVVGRAPALIVTVGADLQQQHMACS